MHIQKRSPASGSGGAPRAWARRVADKPVHNHLCKPAQLDGPGPRTRRHGHASRNNRPQRPADIGARRPCRRLPVRRRGVCHQLLRHGLAQRHPQLRGLAPRSVSRRGIVSQLFTSRQVRRNTVWLVSELHLCAAWGRTCSSPRGARRHISQNSQPMWCCTSPSCCSSRC